ncbi:MAG: fatty acid desaturase [Spirochaetes bacterium]|nr:fatty acid desaturase [Spirochaetota bacterium]
MKVNVLHALGRGDVDYFFWDPLFPKDDPRRRAMCRWARFVLIVHLGLLAVFIVVKLWVLIYLLIFGSFFASILANLCGAIQHTGLAASTPDWRLVCHTVKVNLVIGFLYWHMTYHAEHHMYAAVPFFNLARVHRTINGGMQIPQRSSLAAIGLLVWIKRRQKEDPNYVCVPEFPPTAAPPRRE